MSEQQPAGNHGNHRGGGHFCGRTRREFLWEAAGGFTSVALAGLLGNEWLAQQALAADGVSVNAAALEGAAMRAAAMDPGRFLVRAPKAKSVIFLFMYGGPSQVDTFDHKPLLYKNDGMTIDVPTFGRQGKRAGGRVVGPKWKFRPYGESGKLVSDLFPNLGECVDDIAFIHSMFAESPIHGSALLNMNCGRITSGHPSMGSWVNYGLGSDNQNLPGYVVMLDETGGPISGAKNWTSGFMPANYQGVPLRSQGAPILDLNPSEVLGGGVQRELLDRLKAENQIHAAARAGNHELDSRIAQFELAYRMQSAAPEAVDLSGESEKTLEMYGVEQEQTREFGRKCLLARRMVERGVRFIQLYAGGGHNDDNWDAHGDLIYNHTKHAGRTDRPIAALLTDLKQRGLLDETLVVWGGEFGRQPTAEYESGTGRDHNSWGFTMWMAGGGVKGGISVGETDELGAKAVVDRFHVKNLHATILHLMGMDPNGLTYFFNGLDEKLVGVEGAEPIWQVMA